jgi:hypothetical protein
MPIEDVTAIYIFALVGIYSAYPYDNYGMAASRKWDYALREAPFTLTSEGMNIVPLQQLKGSTEFNGLRCRNRSQCYLYPKPAKSSR